MNSTEGWSPDTQATFCATLVDEWVRCGVTDAVICPGSRSTPLALAFAERADITVHVHHDERSGSFLALGLAQATGRAVAIVTTSGTATVQLHAAVVEADLAGVPLLVCTPDRPPELRSVAAPQTVDQSALYGGAVRWFVDPGVAEDSMSATWRSIASRAHAEATGRWPGPVQLNLPFREPLVGVAGRLPEGRGIGPWHRRVVSGRVAPTLEPSVAAARGVIVAGRGHFDPDDAVTLSRDLGWPLLADPLSNCRGPHGVTAFDPILRTPFAGRTRPDVVIRIGGPPASKVLERWLADSGADEIVVAPAPWWPDPGRRGALFLDEIPVAPDGHPPMRDWLAAWMVADELAQAAIDAALAATPLAEPAVARTLTRGLPPGAALVASSSMPIRDVEWFGTARSDIRHVANRGANGIDGVVSTAVGVAAAGVRTALLVGDVAFLHDINGLLGAVDRGIDLTVVVIDNNGGGIFSFLPQRSQLSSARFEQLFGTPHGLRLDEVARSHGVDAVRASGPDDLEWRPGVRVVVVESDRDDNVAVHATLDAAVAAALTA